MRNLLSPARSLLAAGEPVASFAVGVTKSGVGMTGFSKWTREQPISVRQLLHYSALPVPELPMLHFCCGTHAIVALMKSVGFAVGMFTNVCGLRSVSGNHEL